MGIDALLHGRACTNACASARAEMASWLRFCSGPRMRIFCTRVFAPVVGIEGFVISGAPRPESTKEGDHFSRDDVLWLPEWRGKFCLSYVLPRPEPRRACSHQKKMNGEYFVKHLAKFLVFDIYFDSSGDTLFSFPALCVFRRLRENFSTCTSFAKKK